MAQFRAIVKLVISATWVRLWPKIRPKFVPQVTIVFWELLCQRDANRVSISPNLAPLIQHGASHALKVNTALKMTQSVGFAPKDTSVRKKPWNLRLVGEVPTILTKEKVNRKIARVAPKVTIAIQLALMITLNGPALRVISAIPNAKEQNLNLVLLVHIAMQREPSMLPMIVGDVPKVTSVLRRPFSPSPAILAPSVRPIQRR